MNVFFVSMGWVVARRAGPIQWADVQRLRFLQVTIQSTPDRATTLYLVDSEMTSSTEETYVCIFLSVHVCAMVACIRLICHLLCQGSDVLLGDHGLFDALLPAHQQFVSVFTGAGDAAGNDAIYGEAGDDFIMGQQGADKLYGGPGEDDIIGMRVTC